MANNQSLNLTIKVNDQEVGSTLKEINSEYYRLRGSINKLEEGTNEWTEANKRLAKVEKERTGMIERQKAFREEMARSTDTLDEQTSAMQEFGENFAEAFSAFRSGDVLAFQTAMAAVTAQIKMATAAALKFLATPIGIGLTALAGIAIATQQWAKYNKEAGEANSITQQITKLSGDALDQARVRAKSLEETFGTEFKTSLEVAKGLVKAFGISYEEAFERIENGLVRGGKGNSEFFDSLKEYPRLFAQAGFTVEDFQRIVNTGIDMSIYSDKLPDAIKEFSLSVMEATPAAREALQNAFGKEFTDKLFIGIQNGSISVKDSLGLVAGEAERIGLNAQQAQQLTADLFRGAGEDAGGALVIFEAVNTALNEEERQLTALEEQTIRTYHATLKLGEAKDKALKSDGYAKLSSDASIAWTKIKTVFYEAISFIIESFDQLQQFQVKSMAQVAGVVLALPAILKTSMIEIKNEIVDVILTFGKLGDVAGKIMELDFAGAKSAAVEFKNSFVKEAGDVTTSAEGIANKISETFNSIGARVDANYDKARKGASEAAALENATGTTPTGPNGNSLKKQQEAEKAAAEAAKLQAERAKAALAEEKKRLDAIDALEEEYKKKKEDREADSASKKAELEMQRAIEKAKSIGAEQELIDQITAEHQVKIDEAKKVEEEKELERMRAFEAKKLELENELELARAGTEAEKEEIRKAQELEKEEALYEKKLEKFEEEMAFLQLTEEEKNAVIENLKEAHENVVLGIQKKYTDEKIKDEKRLTAEKKRLLNESLDAAINAAGTESKIGQALLLAKQILAIKETAIQLGLFQNKMALNVGEATGAAATGAAETAKVGFPQNIPLLIGFGVQIAGIISAVKNAAKAKSQVKTGFFFGGDTGNKGLGFIDGSGHEPTGYVHKNEYVIPEVVRKDPEMPVIEAYIEKKRRSKLGYFVDGGPTSEVETLPLPKSGSGSSGESSRQIQLLESILAAVGITGDIFFGYEAEQKRQEAEKELQKIKDRAKIKKEK